MNSVVSATSATSANANSSAADLAGGPIARSWQRCAEAGLDAGQPLSTARASPALLAERLEANARLVAYAQPMIEGLYQHLARSSSMVLLADNEGMILRSLGDTDFIERASRCHLQPGAIWSEHEMGTNAIGTALIEQRTVAVVGEQHYLRRNDFLTCISAPILAPGGGLLGVLDISGDARVAQIHAAALVEMTAGIIENRLIETLPEAAVVLRLHARAEALGSQLEGLAVLSDDGRWLACNRRVQRLVGGSPAAGAAFAAYFATPWPALLEHACRQGDEPLALRTLAGGELLARVSLRAGGKRAVAPAAASVAAPAPTSAADSAPPGTPAVAPGARPSRRPLDELGSDDPRMAEAIRRAGRIAECDIPLLIQGETGSGKEWFAQAFHKSGLRCAGPFVAVNCAAIPATLIETELFGHTEGAFTGARRSGARGKIREADGGTLFLDEIGDMPLALQAVLLRVLETRRVAPLGGQGEEPVDFSLVCASHQPLRQLVEHGLFRGDLFFRLSGMTVSLPPLRERQDFDRVVRRMLAEEERAQSRGKAGRASERRDGEPPGGELRVAPAALDLLRRHSWPGNLRQLRNVLRLAVALLGDERLLTPEYLPPEIVDGAAGDGERGPGGRAGYGECGLRSVQLRLVRETVERHGGNISAAARELGITRTTLYRKLAEGRGEGRGEGRSDKGAPPAGGTG
ncbi:MAG TPA: sigma-54-dependent Fis family transcriptional regulator [Azospira sp.]|nr:sigma-54-dependent Fis family transcriptional regulator [Azospira sp.]